MSSNRVIVDSNGRHFSADSLDRLGDDLMEDILSYLDIEDKSRLEYVSKQFKRLIYNKQIIFEDYKFEDCDENKVRFQELLRKCPNITTIYLSDSYQTDSILNTITYCCPRLQSITFKGNMFSLEAITRFGQQLGPKLKHIGFENQWFSKELMSLCPNLKSLQCEDILSFDLSDKQFLPKLEKIEIRVDSDIDISVFVKLVNKYSNTLKNLIINFESFAPIIRKISYFSKLEVLELWIGNNMDNNVKDRRDLILEKDLQVLAKKLSNMKKIIVAILFEGKTNVFELFDGFQSLQELQYYSPYSKLVKSERAIKPMMNLKRMSVYYLNSDEYSFDNLSKITPNLKSLNIMFSKKISENVFNNLSQLKQMSEIMINIECGDDLN